MKTMSKLLATVACLAAGAAQATDLEVTHWWTSGGEAAAVGVLKDDLAGKGVGWKDMPVAGGGGSDAMTVLRARVVAGDAPTAAQMLGFDIKDWAGTTGGCECRRRGRCGARSASGILEA